VEHYHVATDPDAELVYRAEAILERELPTRELSLAEARALVNKISHAEDIDPPKVLHLQISSQYDALAVPDERVIVVRTKRPSQLTIVHEMAHFLGGTGHGESFRKSYLELVRRYLSIDHHQKIAQLVTKFFLETSYARSNS
jgi:hypothetical protein